jgi:hypothetical protein
METYNRISIKDNNSKCLIMVVCRLLTLGIANELNDGVVRGGGGGKRGGGGTGQTAYI